jgi:hypothetical protein
MFRSRATLGLLLLGTCATGRRLDAPVAARDPARASAVRPAVPADGSVAPAPAAPRPADPGASMQMKEVTEKEWVASVRNKLAQQLAVDPTELHFSPARRLVACVRQVGVAPARKTRRAAPRHYQIVVVDPEGARRGRFRTVQARGSDEPPRDLHFISEDRLLYEVTPPPPPPPPTSKPPARGQRHAKPAARPPPAPPPAPPLPHRFFVIQPVESGRAVRCEGVRFSFTAQRDRLAFVSGPPDRAFVSVDGVQAYPRRGRTTIATDLAWSRDGRSLAFVETPPAAKPRLVLLSEIDNRTGDTTWDLPATAPLDGARVLWAGPGKLVVARTATHPLFTASFLKETPPPAPPEPFKNAGP